MPTPIQRALSMLAVPLLAATAARAQGASATVDFAGKAEIGSPLEVVFRGDPSAFVFVAVGLELRDDIVLTPLGPFHLASPFATLHAGPIREREKAFQLLVPDDPALVGRYVHAEVLASDELPEGALAPELRASATTLPLTSLARTTIVDRGTDASKRFAVLVLNYDPILESKGGKRLHEYLGFNDPHVLAQQYVDAMRVKSGGFVDQVIVDWIDLDEYPVKEDGFQYDDDTYLAHWAAGGGWHMPDLSDYDAIIEDNDLVLRVSSDEIDEVFLFGAPYFGYYESRMAGPNAYWVNSPGMPWVPTTRKFVMMGFNYERGLGSMLHDYGHRLESILWHVYGSWNQTGPTQHLWDEFSRIDLNDPGNAGLGNTHFPPNGMADYDYGNPTPVLSSCDDWRRNVPALQGTRRLVDASEWGATEEGYLLWYFDHFPRKEGRFPDGKLANWWKYTQDFNAYNLSR